MLEFHTRSHKRENTAQFSTLEKMVGFNLYRMFRLTAFSLSTLFAQGLVHWIYLTPLLSVWEYFSTPQSRFIQTVLMMWILMKIQILELSYWCSNLIRSIFLASSGWRNLVVAFNWQALLILRLPSRIAWELKPLTMVTLQTCLLHLHQMPFYRMKETLLLLICRYYQPLSAQHALSVGTVGEGSIDKGEYINQ